MDFSGAMNTVGEWIKNNPSAIGVGGLTAGLGAKIGSAIEQAKANRLARQAANQQNAAAREQLADAANPMQNKATQAAMAAGEQQLAEQQRASEKQNAVMGSTPEMQLAQRQQGLQTLADMYATASSGAYSNYDAAGKAADAAAINPLAVRQQAALGIANSLNKAGDNLLKSGNKAMEAVK